jgi:hypothetical protein
MPDGPIESTCELSLHAACYALTVRVVTLGSTLLSLNTVSNAAVPSPLAKETFMIPGANDPRWRALLTGNADFKFKSPTVGMAIARMRRSVIADSSPTNLYANIQQARELLTRFEGAMREDLARLFP